MNPEISPSLISKTLCFQNNENRAERRVENKTENNEKDKPKVSAIGVVARERGGKGIRQIVKVNWIG